jgi:hypothetical protein
MKSIPFELGEVSLIDEQIVCVTLTKDGDLDEPVIRELIQATQLLSGGKPHAILQDFNGKNVSSSTLAKQAVSVRTEKLSGVIARAFVSYNLHNQLEITHFIQHYKPEIESRIFKTKTEALSWLREVIAARNENA